MMALNLMHTIGKDIYAGKEGGSNRRNSPSPKSISSLRGAFYTQIGTFYIFSDFQL